nr:putative ribonuclease H-like domain-containing protein [Tanacetum cinerariifolium]
MEPITLGDPKVPMFPLHFLPAGCPNCPLKFLGTVKFGNDHVAKIMGYGDYQIGNVTISQGLVRGLSKLKFEKDHLCSACAMGKSTKKTHKPESKDTNREKLYLLHMDLCGPMRKAEGPGPSYPTVNGTEFVNQTLRDYYEEVGISHETSVARSPQQNGVVERRNCTLIEAARTMLIYTQAPLFLWAEAVATACFTQNCSIIRLRHGKTPYELLHSKLPDLSFFHVLVLSAIRQMIVRIWVSYNQRLISESSLVMLRQRKLSEFITGVQDEL